MAAAAAAFAERGFRGATLADIAERADVTTGAIYNHFSGKEDLLVAASRAALETLEGGAPEPSQELPAIAARAVRAFMRPGFAQTRRLLIELHLSATRSPGLASLLSEWHRERLAEWSARVPETAGNPAAVVKLYFLILMGLTHIDALSSVEVPQQDLESILDRLTRCLINPDH
jgi:AcrR family transcriptional regulator